MDIDMLKLLRPGSRPSVRRTRNWYEYAVWLASLGWRHCGKALQGIWIDPITGEGFYIESAIKRAARSEATRMLVARGYRVDALGQVYPADTITLSYGGEAVHEPYTGKPFTLAQAFRAERLHLPPPPPEK